MEDYHVRRARWRRLLSDAAMIRDEALSFGRSWRGFVPAICLALRLEAEAKHLAVSFAH